MLPLKNRKTLYLKKDLCAFNSLPQQDCIYLIDSGKIKLQVGNHVELLEQGEIFFYPKVETDSLHAVATEDTHLVSISFEVLFERMGLTDRVVEMFTKKMFNMLNKHYAYFADPSAKNIVHLLKEQSCEENNSVVDRLKIEAELPHALDNDEFSVNYQPIYGLKNQSIVGFEALMRWQHPVDGRIGPDLFIGVAEETSLINSMGKWIT